MSQRVVQGETIRLYSTFVNSSGNLVDADPVRVDILDPDDIAVVTDATPVEASLGTYYYDYEVPGDAEVGIWTAHWTGVVSSSPVAGDDLFEVVAPGDIEFPPALGESYATVEELKARLGTIVDTDDDRLAEALAAASRTVEEHTGRQFNRDSSATARIYYPNDDGSVFVDDFYTTTGLVVATDLSDGGSFDTTWATADYELYPLNGISEGEPGWPYSRIVAVGNQSFPSKGRRARLQVTARWGWAAVPSPVKEATLILAEGLFKLKDAPHGVAGFEAYGVVRVRENPYVCMLLRKYEARPPVMA